MQSGLGVMSYLQILQSRQQNCRCSPWTAGGDRESQTAASIVVFSSDGTLTDIVHGSAEKQITRNQMEEVLSVININNIHKDAHLFVESELLLMAVTIVRLLALLPGDAGTYRVKMFVMLSKICSYKEL